MPVSRRKSITKSEGYGDWQAIALFFLYCLLYASARLLISSSLEMDEAEQFLRGASFHFAYEEQAPLYTWIYWLVSLFIGNNLITLTAVKYSIYFSFFAIFYILVRSFWGRDESLLITGSLLLFPTYAYEANRDLSHSILVSVMAVLTCLFFVRAVRREATLDYLSLGICGGLGILSKYNFVIFLAALLCSALSMAEGRRAMFNRKIVLSMLALTAISAPHLIWLSREQFPALQFALESTRPGELKIQTPLLTLPIIAVAYEEVLAFVLTVLLIFRRDLVRLGADRDPALLIFPRLALFGLGMPVLGIIIFQTGVFRGRWLAPVYFILPIAFFSLVNLKIKDTKSRAFGYLCIGIAVSVLILRLFVGFFPNATGKIERIHMPYRALSGQLAAKLVKMGFASVRGLAVIADEGNEHLAANFLANMPGARFVPLSGCLKDAGIQKTVQLEGGVYVSGVSKSELAFPEDLAPLFPRILKESLVSSYLHSDKSCVVQVFIIPPAGGTYRFGLEDENVHP